jgi:hypothetical protein
MDVPLLRYPPNTPYALALAAMRVYAPKATLAATGAHFTLFERCFY